MKRQNFITLSAATAVLLIAGIWISVHRNSQQSEAPGTPLFPDLKAAVDQVQEIRLSKGDGSRTTLKKDGNGWTVVERQYPADGSRVRDLLLGLMGMKLIETKTSDPANYAKLGVEGTDNPTAAGSLVEVVAPKQTWSLIVGKGAEGRSLYVRKPAEKASALVEPSVSADPDQKRWVDRKIADVPGANVHQVSVQPASGPAYLLTRAARGDSDLALSPVPAGRKVASSMVVNGQADALAAFNFDDVHPAPAAPGAAADRVTYRLFDGQVLEFTGHKTGDKAFVSVVASRDAALAAQFAEPPKTAAVPATPADPARPAADAAKPAETAAPADETVERLAARAKGVEYEIPTYKYDALFKPLEDLLEKKPEPAKGAAAKKPQSAAKSAAEEKP